ncbi:hypothetical protein ACVWYQ_003621 [Bradyrhizobium sp. USDA 3397]
MLADYHATWRAHADAFDLAEDDGPAAQLGGVAGGVTDLKPADRFAGEAIARKVLGGFRGVLPQEFTEICALVAVKLEMPRRHLDEALQRVHARPGRERVSEILVRKALLDQLGVAHALHVTHAHEQRLRGLDPEGVDNLGAQAPEHL